MWNVFGPAVPSAAPDDVAVEVMNNSLVKVSWTRVHKDKLHGHLGGYRVIPQNSPVVLRHGLKGETLTSLDLLAPSHNSVSLLLAAHCSLTLAKKYHDQDRGIFLFMSCCLFLT